MLWTTTVATPPMRFPPLLFTSIALLTLWFGLRPFNFIPPNDVQNDTANHQAMFNQSLAKGTQESRGAAFTPQPISFDHSTGITFHIKLTPQRKPDGLGHILSFNDGHKQAAFSITQWQDHLELFTRRPLAAKGYQEASVRNILPPGKPVTLTIASSPDATAVFVNSTLVRRLPGFAFFQDAENTTGQLILGNNAAGTQPWHGSIEEITLYNQSDRDAPNGLPAAQPLLHYTFATIDNQTVPNRANSLHALHVPEHFTPLARTLLVSFPIDELGSDWLWLDILINIIGFMPLGLCFALMLDQGQFSPWMHFGTVVAICFLFSLAIEAAQAFLPNRDSSLLDLLCNTLGAGLAAARFIEWKRKA